MVQQIILNIYILSLCQNPTMSVRNLKENQKNAGKEKEKRRTNLRCIILKKRKMKRSEANV